MQRNERGDLDTMVVGIKRKRKKTAKRVFLNRNGKGCTRSHLALYEIEIDGKKKNICCTKRGDERNRWVYSLPVAHKFLRIKCVFSVWKKNHSNWINYFLMAKSCFDSFFLQLGNIWWARKSVHNATGVWFHQKFVRQNLKENRLAFNRLGILRPGWSRRTEESGPVRSRADGLLEIQYTSERAGFNFQTDLNRRTPLISSDWFFEIQLKESVLSSPNFPRESNYATGGMWW